MTQPIDNCVRFCRHFYSDLDYFINFVSYKINMLHNFNRTLIIKGILAILLLLCLIKADYGYYQAMRTLISFGFAFLTYQYYQSGDKKNAIVFFCFLVVFQPLLNIALGRDLWMVLDVATALLLLYQIFRQTSSSKKEKTILDREPNKEAPTVRRQGNLRINFPDKEKR